MKQIFFLAASIFFMELSAFGQNLYVDLIGGYSFGLASEEITYNSDYSFSDNYVSYEIEQVKGSFGQGSELGVDIGLRINDNFGMELRGDYLYSRKFTGENNSVYSTTGSLPNSSSGITEYSAQMVRIIPSAIFRIQREKISPYAGLGLALGFGKVSYKEKMTSSDMGNQSMEMVFNGSVAVGFSARMGLELGMSEKLSLIGELNVISMSYAPRYGEIIEKEENGVDMLPTLNRNEREVVFVDKITSNSSNQPDPDQPGEDLKVWFPFSSCGLKIAFRFIL